MKVYSNQSPHTFFSNHLTSTDPTIILTPDKVTGRLQKRKRMTDGLTTQHSLGKTDCKHEQVGAHLTLTSIKHMYSMLCFLGEGKEGEAAADLCFAQIQKSGPQQTRGQDKNPSQ